MPVSTTGGYSRLWSILGYLIPIIFFIPLLTEERNSEFSRYHANQQLNVLLAYIVAMFLTAFTLGILFILYFVVFLISIFGIVHAANGDMKPVPLIGGLKLIK